MAGATSAQRLAPEALSARRHRGHLLTTTAVGGRRERG